MGEGGTGGAVAERAGGRSQFNSVDAPCRPQCGAGRSRRALVGARPHPLSRPHVLHAARAGAGMQSWGGREPRAGAGPLAPRFQLATPGRPERGRGRFVQRRRHPIGGPSPGEPAGSLTCRHPGFPRPAPSWEARPPAPYTSGWEPSSRSPRSSVPCACFLPPCEARACAVVRSPAPRHPPWAILPGVGRQPDSRGASTPSAAPARVLSPLAGCPAP